MALKFTISRSFSLFLISILSLFKVTVYRRCGFKNLTLLLITDGLKYTRIIFILSRVWYAYYSMSKHSKLAKCERKQYMHSENSIAASMHFAFLFFSSLSFCLTVFYFPQSGYPLLVYWPYAVCKRNIRGHVEKQNPILTRRPQNTRECSFPWPMDIPVAHVYVK